MASQISNEVKVAAIFPSLGGSDWDSVKLRQVWGDRSSWAEFWAIECLRNEIAEKETFGKRARPVEFVRMRGANHFVSFDSCDSSLHHSILSNDYDL